MSDRYGYDGRRSSRDDDRYGRYGDRYDRQRDADRYSRGATSYGRSTNRRTVSYNSEDDFDYPQTSRRSTSRSSSYSTSRRSVGSSRRRVDDHAFDDDRGSSSRSGRSRTRDDYGSESRRSTGGSTSGSGTRRRQVSSDAELDAHSTRRNARVDGGDASRSSTRRFAQGSSSRSSAHRSRTDSASSRYSRSSYGSEHAHADASTTSKRQHAASSRSRQSAHAALGPSEGSGGVSSGSGAAASYAQPRRRRNIAVVVAVIVGVLLVGAVAAFAYVGSITNSLHEGVDQDLRAALVETDMANEPFYMLLLGTDKISWREGTEDGGQYRSDTMILARVDAPNGTISLISIPRDTLVELGDYGWQKINVAYGLGGPSLAVEAVSKLTGVDISHYAEVDMDGLAAVVDAIGGIEVEVPVEIDDSDAGGYLAAGLQTLNGEQALILCRSRNTYIETSAAPDLMRAANQRMVLSAIAHKVLDADVATIANTVRSAANYVTTDLELNDIIGLAQALQGMDTDDAFYTASLPSHSVYVVGGYGYPDTMSAEPTDVLDASIPDGWYGLLDEADWSVMKGRMSEGLPPAEGIEIDEATGTVLSTAGSGADDISEKYAWITIMNGTDRDGLATRAMGVLNAAGFENITLEDAYGEYDYPETLVIYDEVGRSHEAEQIVDALGQGRAVVNDGSWIVENNFLVIIGDDWRGTSTASSSASSSAESASAGSSQG